LTDRREEKVVNKIQSNSSGRDLVLRGCDSSEPQLLRILLGSGFGAENRFKKSSGSGTDIPGVYSSFFSARIKVARASSIARSKCSEAAA
jgi:hypothetical protein